MRLALLLLAACGACGAKKDDCNEVKLKARPVLVSMFRTARRPLLAPKLEGLIVEFCPSATKTLTESEQTRFRCVLRAADDTAIEACLEAEFNRVLNALPNDDEEDAPADAAVGSDAGGQVDAADPR